MRRLSNTIVTRSSLALLAAGILAGCGGGSAAEPTALKGTVAGVPTTSPLAGIQDDRVWQVPAKEATSRVNTMTKLGASIIRVDMRWDQVAPTRPKRPKDQFDPAYKWDAFDAVVDAAAQRGVKVLFTVWGTPGWAADPAVKKSTTFPDWARRPLRPGPFGDFACQHLLFPRMFAARHAATRRHFSGGPSCQTARPTPHPMPCSPAL